MLSGTADVDRLLAGAPTMPALDTDALTLPGVEIVHAVVEMGADTMLAALPPSLHPTLPPTVHLIGWRCPDSPWGPFSLAQLRVGCRSGLRPRGYAVAAWCDVPAAVDALAGRWGYPVAPGQVTVRRGYDRGTVAAVAGSRTAFAVSVDDPVALAPADVQPIASMHLAHTPRGPRLVQVDPDIELHQVERGRPTVTALDAPLAVRWPVAGWMAAATITLPRLRFLCDPAVPAFTSTERI